MSVEARSGARRPAERSVVAVLLGDVVGLRDPRGGHRRTAGVVALGGSLGGGPPFGDPRRLVGGLLHLLIGRGPALLELDARRRMPVRLVRGALATPAGADRPSFPARLGECVLALLEAPRVVTDPLLQIAHGDAVDHRPDAGTPPRQHARLLALLLAVPPARQFDRLLADAADVDRSLGEDRIVAE